MESIKEHSLADIFANEFGNELIIIFFILVAYFFCIGIPNAGEESLKSILQSVFEG